MKPLLPFLLCYVMVTASLQAQQLKGITVNEKEAPIPGDGGWKLYLEGGYSIGFLGLGRIGIFTGLNDKKFDRFGVRLSYPLWNFMERPLK